LVGGGAHVMEEHADPPDSNAEQDDVLKQVYVGIDTLYGPPYRRYEQVEWAGTKTHSAMGRLVPCSKSGHGPTFTLPVAFVIGQTIGFKGGGIVSALQLLVELQQVTFAPSIPFSAIFVVLHHADVAQPEKVT